MDKDDKVRSAQLWIRKIAGPVAVLGKLVIFARTMAKIDIPPAASQSGVFYTKINIHRFRLETGRFCEIHPFAW